MASFAPSPNSFPPTKYSAASIAPFPAPFIIPLNVLAPLAHASAVLLPKAWVPDTAAPTVAVTVPAAIVGAAAATAGAATAETAITAAISPATLPYFLTFS